jgi:hypothetical protein
VKLQFSVAARNRKFSKAMDRIDPRFTALTDAFEGVELAHPIHEAILVLITDDKDSGFLEEVENNDGFFQVMAGCSLRGGDDELAEDVFEILLKAMRLCPFATPDHETFEALFERLRPTVLS